IFPGLISRVAWCQKAIEGITDHPCNQALAPSATPLEGQKGKRKRNADGRNEGSGGGFSANNTLIKSPPSDQRVSAVSQAVGTRGLRVTRYIPSHREARRATKLTVKVIWESVIVPHGIGDKCVHYT